MFPTRPPLPPAVPVPGADSLTAQAPGSGHALAPPPPPAGGGLPPERPPTPQELLALGDDAYTALKVPRPSRLGQLLSANDRRIATAHTDTAVLLVQQHAKYIETLGLAIDAFGRAYLVDLTVDQFNHLVRKITNSLAYLHQLNKWWSPILLHTASETVQYLRTIPDVPDDVLKRHLARQWERADRYADAIEVGETEAIKGLQDAIAQLARTVMLAARHAVDEVPPRALPR